MRCLGIVGALFFLVPSVSAQTATINSDCALTLQGDVEGIQGIFIRFSESHLFTLDSRDIDGIGTVALHAPYLIGGSSVLLPNSVTLTGPRIGATEATTTSILFTGTYDDVVNTNIQVEIARSFHGEEIAFDPGPKANYANCAQIEPGIFAGSRSFSGILGGVASDEKYASIVDGAVTINGTFENLSGIEVRATRDGQIELETIEIGDVGSISVTTPFESGRTIVRDRVIVLGAAGRDNQLNIEQSRVKTAILYNGDDPEADLRVQYGSGAQAFQLPFGGEVGAADGGFLVEDGYVTLVGEFSRLSGIEVNSSSGNLMVDTSASGAVQTAPFDASSAILFDELDGRRITLGVDTVAGRIDGTGKLRTSIRYDGTPEEALSDLTLRVGIAGQGALALSPVPEPSGLSYLVLATCVLISTRRSRTD